MKVTDAGGASTTSEEITITVANPPGNAAPSVQALADPTSGTAPLRVRFTSASSDPDGDQLLSVWDFGDGVKAGGDAATHTYTQPGTYNAKVTVTDPGGKSATSTVQVVVRAVTGSRRRDRRSRRRDTGDVAGETQSRPLVRLTKSHKVARVLRRGLRYTVSCEARCRVTSVLRIAGGEKQRLGASRARMIAAGHSRKIVLKLDRQVRRNLVARDAQGARAQPEGDRRPDRQDGGRHDHAAQAGRARARLSLRPPGGRPDPGGGRRASSVRTLMRGFANVPN